MCTYEIINLATRTPVDWREPPRRPEVTSTPFPPPGPKERGNPTTIVELGAGTYSNAIKMKKANPSGIVFATNLRSEWADGSYLYNRGSRDRSIHSLDVFMGWQEAQDLKLAGMIIGTTQPIENSDVASGIGDLVYTIMPYPSSARSFGQQAARIAKSAPGTTVAVTSGGSSAATWFIDGFKSMRPGSNFFRESGSPYGIPGEWESGPYVTWKYTVP